MNVLFASAEVVPFAKAGGLGDVVGSLPKALRAIGVDARVIMPMYGFINREAFKITPLFNFYFSKRDGTAEIYISYTEYEGVPIYFVTAWPFFGDGGHLYTDWNWDVPRFIFLAQAVLAAMWQLGQGAGGQGAWFPDVINVNDWHTALIPFLVETGRADPRWGRMGTVLTVHNMAYQGPYAGGFLYQAGIPGRDHWELTGRGLNDNLMAIGMAYSDTVSTVSPRYATEMMTPRYGEGLEGLVNARAQYGDVIGILNGIDMDRWNPATDKMIAHPFTAETFLEGRAACKSDLQRRAGIEQRPEVPLIGVVSRLTDQKGIDLAIPALRQLLQERDCQFVVLGTGEPALENALWNLGQVFPNRVRSWLQYDAQLSQRIYSAVDLFLMPSRYEPCGTSQMLAMRYGSLPVVRETGGLADTVQNYDGGNADYGTGFVFLWETPDAVLGTLRWAVDTYQNRPTAFRRMQRRAMGIDFSWRTSAGRYVEMYERAIRKHR
jgi:starch synthase